MLSDRLNQDELPHINMTPMVDVVLCLLIFFMIATRLEDWDQEQFQVKVPEVVSASALVAAPDDLELSVIAPGQVVWNGKNFGLSDLTDALKQARDAYPDQGVLIRGEASLNYQHIADVLSACESAGIQNVRLPVKPRRGPDGG
jgi:biopolymer transport protein ExbD